MEPSTNTKSLVDAQFYWSNECGIIENLMEKLCQSQSNHEV